MNNNNLTNIPESISILTKIKRFRLGESSYDINNLSMNCHTLVLTDIKNNITNLPPILRTLYLKSNINVDMIKILAELRGKKIIGISLHNKFNLIDLSFLFISMIVLGIKIWYSS